MLYLVQTRTTADGGCSEMLTWANGPREAMRGCAAAGRVSIGAVAALSLAESAARLHAERSCAGDVKDAQNAFQAALYQSIRQARCQKPRG